MAEITNTTTSYDYSMIGSFGSDATQSLNGETINKIRAAEEKAVLDPIVQDLENWELESEKIVDLQVKVNELREAVKAFDLFSTSNNAFEQISATTTGTSAVFDAADVGSLKEGIYNVEVTALSQKDIWQSDGYTQVQAEAALAISGSLNLSGPSGATLNIAEVNGMTLQEIADQINTSTFATASVEQTGDDEYKLVIKSAEPGTANALTITGTSQLATDYNDLTDTDGDGNPDNHPLAAQNLEMTVDGIDYNVSSSNITIDGNLKITATELGSSTLSITKDDSSIAPLLETMVEKYNAVVGFISNELYDTESPIEDKSSIRDLLSNIKNMFFTEYGPNDATAVDFGFEFDKNGLLSLNTDVLGEALTSDYDSVKDFFLGVAEDKGFGTSLKEYIDDINSYDGLFTTYQNNMVSRKESLEEEKEDTIDRLDTKYSTMAAQFVQYASIIAQMESAFGGLKMMIAQSTASN